MVFARALARYETLGREINQLDEETEEVRRDATAQRGADLPADFLDNYFKGQAWRREQLMGKFEEARKEMEQTRMVWNAARIRLRQVEKLEEREGKHLKAEAHKREMKELDMIGALRHVHNRQH